MAYPASDQKPPCATGCSRAQGPSGASPAPSSAHRTPGATDNTSPRSRQSDGLRPPCSGLVRPEHRPAATWRRSLQACIASLPLQSSLMSKTYLKSDHFSGGGAVLAGGDGFGKVVSRYPWLPVPFFKVPTIWPLLLMPDASVVWPFTGSSIVVKTSPL